MQPSCSQGRMPSIESGQQHIGKSVFRNAVIGCSVVLAAAVFLLVMISYVRPKSVHHEIHFRLADAFREDGIRQYTSLRRRKLWFACLQDGKLYLAWQSEAFRSFPFVGFESYSVDYNIVSHTTGVDHQASTNIRKVSFSFAVIRIPLWATFILLSLYPAIAFIRGPFRRYRCRKKGLCLTCGYNLTGNISGVCPECSTPLDPKLLETQQEPLPPNEEAAS